MRRYIHEDSPYDDVFKGVRAYEEVQNRVQNLLPDQQSGFLSFQKHRRTNLPNILQGESNISLSSQEIASTEPQQGSSTTDQAEEVAKNPEELIKNVNTPMLGKKDQEMLASFEAFMKQGHAFPFSPSTTTFVVPSVTSPEKSTALTSTILSLTPITTSFETPSSEAIHIDELTPILPEEMPPSSFFFNKKRRAIIRRESQQKEGVVTKRNIIVYDGQGQNDPEFSKEVADSLGAFATANQWSVDNLIKQLQQKSLQVEHLQNEMQRVEITFRSRMNFDIEQIRLGYQQQMKQLQEKLEVSVQNLQSSNSMLSQQNSLIEQLQTQIVVLENTKIDHVAFKMKASEINERLGVVQLDLYQAMDTIQKYYQRINTSLKNIYDKEKEACAARSKFQEFIVWRQKVNFPGLAPFSQYEQMKGKWF
jgi:hypothetical protein